MKEIKDMNLAECLDGLDAISRYNRPIIDRIHDLTRWVPVSERMPTQEDGDMNGSVLVLQVENESPSRQYHELVNWREVCKPDYFYTDTHWRRITPPEDKP